MDFDPQRKVLSFQVLDDCANFRQNRFKIATMRARTDRQTHRDHTSDLIICPMLCYSNGTDNNVSWRPPTSECENRVKGGVARAT